MFIGHTGEDKDGSRLCTVWRGGRFDTDTVNIFQQIATHLGERSVTSVASACAVSAEPAAVSILHSASPALPQLAELKAKCTCAGLDRLLICYGLIGLPLHTEGRLMQKRTSTSASGREPSKALQK